MPTPSSRKFVDRVAEVAVGVRQRLVVAVHVHDHEAVLRALHCARAASASVLKSAMPSACASGTTIRVGSSTLLSGVERRPGGRSSVERRADRLVRRRPRRCSSACRRWRRTAAARSRGCASSGRPRRARRRDPDWLAGRAGGLVDRDGDLGLGLRTAEVLLELDQRLDALRLEEQVVGHLVDGLLRVADERGDRRVDRGDARRELGDLLDVDAGCLVRGGHDVPSCRSATT